MSASAEPPPNPPEGGGKPNGVFVGNVLVLFVLIILFVIDNHLRCCSILFFLALRYFVFVLFIAIILFYSFSLRDTLYGIIPFDNFFFSLSI